MAKITGEQSIPSEDLENYRSALGEARADGTVEKRMPFRLPQCQAGRAGETPQKLKQRNSFKAGLAKFKLLSQADRQRWYNRMPPWSSYLWYYNWFMLNAVPNLWQAIPGGDAMLNNIQVVKTDLSVGGGLIDIPSEVIATKCVVMLMGAAYDVVEAGEPQYAYAWAIYPILSSISNTQIDLRWGTTPQGSSLVSATIIEYI